MARFGPTCSVSRVVNLRIRQHAWSRTRHWEGNAAGGEAHVYFRGPFAAALSAAD